MKLPIILSALLLSSTPAFAQFDRDNNCIRNKESEMQRYERIHLTAYQETLNPENIVELTRQLEEAGKFFKDLSQREKNSIAYKLMTDQLTRIKSQIEEYKTYPDCSELQGGKEQ